MNKSKLLLLLFAVLLLRDGSEKSAAQELALQEQRAFREATTAVADSVVQIRTIGGLDRVGKTLIAGGPTTGLIISEDGYIVSSAFNFAGEPSSILVRLADGEQFAAKLVSRDQNRMLVLLKINAGRSLPVPSPTDIGQLRVGQWSIALGRTFQTDAVDVSIGIVSALNRKYGRVVQTDANVSVANYGGPLVDIYGRVIGVLVPMSPQSGAGEENALAGAEFYDSGIGFAVPLQHVLGVFERWKEETELLPGKLGIGLSSGDAHVTEPKITSVWPGSPAAKADWKANDLITAVNGKPVATQAQLRFQIMPLYADDTIQVALDREGEQVDSTVTLTGKLAPYRHPFLGVLPSRSSESDQPEGATVGLVWPGSPADLAGLKAGDQIVKVNETVVKADEDLRKSMLAMHPQESLVVSIVRGEDELDLSVTLGTMPEEILSATELLSYIAEGDSTTTDEPELQELAVPEFTQQAAYYAPTLDKGQQPGLLLWLGNGDDARTQELVDQWQADCATNGWILLIAAPADAGKWTSDDLSYLQQLVRLATRRFNVDRRKMVTIGRGKAGQLAYALAFGGRLGSAGVVSIDGPLPRTLTPQPVSPSSRLAVLAIESKNSNFAPLIRRDIDALQEAGYPTTKLQRSSSKNDQSDQLDAATRSSITRWMIGLDRI